VPNHPYISVTSGLVSAFVQLRKGFPSKVDAGYLKRFNIAPSNEFNVIAILKYLGLIDDDGNRVESKTGYFFGGDDAFQSGLEGALRSAYPQLFDEMGDGALDAERSTLTSWFRGSDKTTELVGNRQASTFQILAALAGHGELPKAHNGIAKKTPATPSTPIRKATNKKTTKQAAAPAGESSDRGGKIRHGNEVGLTVRIEVNLPPGGDADTYDAIFASIKTHLMP